MAFLIMPAPTSAETIQDATGASFVDSTDIDFTYNDPANTITGVLTASGASAGSYGSSTLIPVLTVDAKGRITAISTAAVSASPSFPLLGSNGTVSAPTYSFSGDTDSGMFLQSVNNVSITAASIELARFDGANGDVIFRYMQAAQEGKIKLGSNVNAPWFALGSGPTRPVINMPDTSAYLTISLNSVAKVEFSNTQVYSYVPVRAASLGVANSAAATTPGSVVKKIQIFDDTGVSLGYIAVYDSIT